MGLVGTDVMDAPGIPGSKLKLALAAVLIFALGENVGLYAHLSWPAAAVAVPVVILIVAIGFTWRLPQITSLRLPLVGLLMFSMGLLAYAGSRV